MQYLITILTRFAIKGINLLTFLLLARLLTIQDFSTYGLIFNTTLLMSILLDLGMRNSIANSLGQKPQLFSLIYNFINGYFIILIPILLVLGIATSYYELIALNKLVLLLSLFILIGLTAIRTYQGFFLGLDRIGIINRSDVLQKILLFFLVLFAFFLSLANIEFILVAFALSTSLGVIYLIKKIKNIEIVIDKSVGEFDRRKIIKHGTIFMIGAFSMIAYKKVGFYVTDFLGGENLSGIYFGINRFAEVITEVGVAISMVLFSKSVTNSNRVDKINSALKTGRVSILVLAALCIMLSFFADYAILYTLGDNFVGYANLYRLALFASFIGLIPTVLFPTLSVLYKPTKVAALYLLTLIVNGIASCILFEAFSIQGVMLSLVICNFALVSTISMYIARKENISLKDFFIIKSSDLKFLKSKLSK